VASLLEAELKTYEAHKAELLGSADGKWVLIHEGDILGVFDSKMDAIGHGYATLGNVPFLVKQVTQVEIPQTFTSNLISL
jgi:hypothetical protein